MSEQLSSISSSDERWTVTLTPHGGPPFRIAGFDTPAGAADPEFEVLEQAVADAVASPHPGWDGTNVDLTKWTITLRSHNA